MIGLFSDIEPRWGGTILSGGSHRRTARVLAEHPRGLDHRTLFEVVLADPLGDFVEVTGRAGDVVLAHPFMFHARGFKHAGPPRVISNTETGLLEPMRVGPGNGHDLAPVEIAIRRALEEPLPAQRGLQRCRC